LPDSRQAFATEKGREKQDQFQDQFPMRKSVLLPGANADRGR